MARPMKQINSNESLLCYRNYFLLLSGSINSKINQYIEATKELETTQRISQVSAGSFTQVTNKLVLRIYQIVTGWRKKLNCLRHENGTKWKAACKIF